MRRVVIDPGVLVAALITPTGPPARVVQAVRRGELEVVLSPHLLAELTMVLRRTKFRPYVTIDEAAEYVDGISRLALTLADPAQPRPVCRDPHDDYLVALLEVSGADAIVSGDGDLLALDSSAVRVVTPTAVASQLGDTG